MPASQLARKLEITADRICVVLGDAAPGTLYAGLLTLIDAVCGRTAHVVSVRDSGVGMNLTRLRE